MNVGAIALFFIPKILTISRQQDVVACRNYKGRLAVPELYTSFRSENITTPQKGPQPRYETAAPARASAQCGEEIPKLSVEGRV
jgi:hypothetical protein